MFFFWEGRKAGAREEGEVVEEKGREEKSDIVGKRCRVRGGFSFSSPLLSSFLNPILYNLTLLSLLYPIRLCCVKEVGMFLSSLFLFIFYFILFLGGRRERG